LMEQATVLYDSTVSRSIDERMCRTFLIWK
jgi:hypothetical protein